MSDIILYHYPLSPFSEKIIAMFGYTGIRWSSVIESETPPRPQLAKLAGGYRRIPVAQIGADIFCDSKTIATEIARISGKADLALENCDYHVQAYANRADCEIFLACFGTANGRKLIMKLFNTLSLTGFSRFMWDRIKMGRKSSLEQISSKEARALVLDHLKQMEQMLNRDFLFGEQPNIADFSAYHGLWFIQDVGERDIIKDFPRVTAWMNRIKAFGSGIKTEISAEQAIDIAVSVLCKINEDTIGISGDGFYIITFYVNFIYLYRRGSGHVIRIVLPHDPEACSGGYCDHIVIYIGCTKIDL